MKKRHLNPPPPVVPQRAALGYNPPPPIRVPPRFIEAMRRITGTEPPVNPEPKRNEPTRAAGSSCTQTHGLPRRSWNGKRPSGGGAQGTLSSTTPAAPAEMPCRGAAGVRPEKAPQGAACHPPYAPPAVNKWKSSFKVLGDQEDNPQMQTTNSPERTELYDPSSPLSSDSEPEAARAPPPTHSPPSLEVILPRQHHDSGRWDIESRLPDRLDLVPGGRPAGSRGLSPGFTPAQGRAYSAEAELLGCPGFGFNSLDKQNHHPPDRIPPQQIGASAGEEGRIVPERRREAVAPPTKSPPRFKRDYLRPLEAGKPGRTAERRRFQCVTEDVLLTAEVDQDLPRTKVTKTGEATAAQSRCPITCDLCDVGVANAQELQAHLDCKSHWDTLQYIQEHNSYDDVTTAFLQEVMLSKSLHCSRAIEDSALTALQENDHMTKVEMFHCAACKLLVPTSGADVKAHITSMDHLCNTKEFEEQQRRACLSKAETLMKELKPQFEHFLNVLKHDGQT